MYQVFYYTLYSVKRLPNDRLTSDKYDIKTHLQSGMKLAYGFSHQPSNTITGDGVSRLFAGYKAVAVKAKAVGN
jgi:hypothetical protein